MNAEKEKLMHATYQQFMEAGLNLNDGDGIIRIISEEIMGFGTTGVCASTPYLIYLLCCPKLWQLRVC